jgi:IS5 family transposase
LLALVSDQDVEVGDEPGSWRIARETRPDRMVSTVDPESRHVHKTTHNYRDGFKAHIAVEPDSGLVTACDLTAGNVGDAQAAPGLIAEEPAGTEVLGDSAYGSGEFRAHLENRQHRAVIKPIPLRPAVPGGFTIDDFYRDGNTMTCPAGITVNLTRNRTARFGLNCRHCPIRSRCTTSARGKIIKLHEHHDLLAAARLHANSDEFDDTYRRHRPMVERSLAWLVRRGHRKVRYRGIERNRIGLAHRVAAVNLQRLITLGLNWNGSWSLTQ